MLPVRARRRPPGADPHSGGAEGASSKPLLQSCETRRQLPRRAHQRPLSPDTHRHRAPPPQVIESLQAWHRFTADIGGALAASGEILTWLEDMVDINVR